MATSQKALNQTPNGAVDMGMNGSIGRNSGEQPTNMWEELNKPRARQERPAPTPPPPAPADPAPIASEPAEGPSPTAEAMKRIDSQYLLVIGGVMFVVVAFVALKGLGGSTSESAAPEQAAVTSPDRLPSIDETTTIPTTAVPSTVAGPTAMGLPAELLDGPQSAVYRLYRTALGREPDREGFQFWSDEVRAGTPLEQLADDFLASEEFAGQFSSDWSADERAELLLTNAFGPAADELELATWLDRYRGLSGSELLVAISEADETLTITGTLR